MMDGGAFFPRVNGWMDGWMDRKVCVFVEKDR